MNDPRSHQSKREAFRRKVLAAHGPTCQMPSCKMPSRHIDLRLKHPHPGSYEADHIETCAQLKARRAPLAAYYDPSNGRPAHKLCNGSAGATTGNRTRKPTTGHTARRTDPLNRSRTW